MCNMDVLNEPEILNNLKRRYKQDRIFTKIGPTLIVINPYKVIQPLFNHQVLRG
jgi:myosin heavy subunit